MLDLGFEKLLVIGLVGIVVLGPERLPKVAKAAGILWARGQRFVQDITQQVHQTSAQITRPLENLQKDIDHYSAGLQTDLHAAYQDGHASQPSDIVLPRYIKKKRQGYQSWRVQTGRLPEWYKGITQKPRRLQGSAARVRRYKT